VQELSAQQIVSTFVSGLRVSVGFPLAASSFSVVGFLVLANPLHVVLTPKADILPSANTPFRLADLARVQPA
jgi:hypothetical protein